MHLYIYNRDIGCPRRWLHGLLAIFRFANLVLWKRDVGPHSPLDTERKPLWIGRRRPLCGYTDVCLSALSHTWITSLPYNKLMPYWFTKHSLGVKFITSQRGPFESNPSWMTAISNTRQWEQHPYAISSRHICGGENSVFLQFSSLLHNTNQEVILIFKSWSSGLWLLIDW
jgi:hypothetical protein